MGKSKLKVEDVIFYSPEHGTQHCDIKLRGRHDDYGVKPGDFVTLTKVEPEAKPNAMTMVEATDVAERIRALLGKYLEADEADKAVRGLAIIVNRIRNIP